MLLIVGVVFAVVASVILYACCVMAGRYDDAIEDAAKEAAWRQ